MHIVLLHRWDVPNMHQYCRSHWQLLVTAFSQTAQRVLVRRNEIVCPVQLEAWQGVPMIYTGSRKFSRVQ